MENAEIKERCYFNMNRFGAAVAKMKLRYPHNEFEAPLRESLETIIGISLNPDGYTQLKSDAYYNYFLEENPKIDLSGNNPFYILNFNKNLSIDIIYVMVEESRSAGLEKILFRGCNDIHDNHKVCAFDLLFDVKDKNIAEIKPIH